MRYFKSTPVADRSENLLWTHHVCSVNPQSGAHTIKDFRFLFSLDLTNYQNMIQNWGKTKKNKKNSKIEFFVCPTLRTNRRPNRTQHAKSQLQNLLCEMDFKSL